MRSYALNKQLFRCVCVGEREREMGESSKDLLNLEKKSSSSSTIGLSLSLFYVSFCVLVFVLVHIWLTGFLCVFCAESKLIVCKNDFVQTQNSNPKPPDGMPFTSSVPKSQGTPIFVPIFFTVIHAFLCMYFICACTPI